MAKRSDSTTLRVDKNDAAQFALDARIRCTR